MDESTTLLFQLNRSFNSPQSSFAFNLNSELSPSWLRYHGVKDVTTAAAATLSNVDEHS